MRRQTLDQQVDEGGGDGDDHALQDAEADRADHADHGEQEFGPAGAPELGKGADIDQRDRGGGQHGAERGIGHQAQRPAQKGHREHQRQCGDHGGELAPAAHRQVHGGARIRSGHGQAAEQARGDVGRAEADQLAIGVDPLAGPCGEAPDGDDARAEADEEHGTCAEQELVERHR